MSNSYHTSIHSVENLKYSILHLEDCLSVQDNMAQAAASYQDFFHLEDKFNSVCKQLKLVNSRITELQTRYDRAASENRRSFRYILRIHIVSLEGVRTMYYKYAVQMAEDLVRMKEGRQ